MLKHLHSPSCPSYHSDLFDASVPLGNWWPVLLPHEQNFKIVLYSAIVDDLVFLELKTFTERFVSNTAEAMSRHAPAPSSVTPLIKFEQGTGVMSARIVATKDCDEGTVMARIEGEACSESSMSYATVQIACHQHLNLSNDLIYTNHSCDPSLIFDIDAMEARVIDGRQLKKGDELTFFYPSTEWDMAQPFDCNCGAGDLCLGVVQGAKHLSRQKLEQYRLSKHIVEMMNNGPSGDPQKQV